MILSTSSSLALMAGSSSPGSSSSSAARAEVTFTPSLWRNTKQEMLEKRVVAHNNEKTDPERSHTNILGAGFSFTVFIWKKTWFRIKWFVLICKKRYSLDVWKRCYFEIKVTQANLNVVFWRELDAAMLQFNHVSRRSVKTADFSLIPELI